MDNKESNQRKHLRITTPKVLVRIPTVNRLKAHYLRDLSEGGLFIRTDKPLPLDRTVDIELEFPGWKEPLHLHGRVVRIDNGEQAQKNNAVGVAVKFEELPAETQARLAQIIAEHKEPGSVDAEQLDRLRSQVQNLSFELSAAHEALSTRPTNVKDPAPGIAEADVSEEEQPLIALAQQAELLSNALRAVETQQKNVKQRSEAINQELENARRKSAEAEAQSELNHQRLLQAEQSHAAQMEAAKQHAQDLTQQLLAQLQSHADGERQKTQEAHQQQLTQLQALAENERQRTEEAHQQQLAQLQAQLDDKAQAEQGSAEKLAQLAQAEQDAKVAAEKLAQAELTAKASADQLAALEQAQKENAEKLASLEQERQAFAQKLAQAEQDLKLAAEKLAQAEMEAKAGGEKLASLEQEHRAHAEKLAQAELAQTEQLAKLTADHQAQLGSLQAKLEDLLVQQDHAQKAHEEQLALQRAQAVEERSELESLRQNQVAELRAQLESESGKQRADSEQQMREQVTRLERALEEETERRQQAERTDQEQRRAERALQEELEAKVADLTARLTVVTERLADKDAELVAAQMNAMAQQQQAAREAAPPMHLSLVTPPPQDEPSVGAVALPPAAAMPTSAPAGAVAVAAVAKLRPEVEVHMEDSSAARSSPTLLGVAPIPSVSIPLAALAPPSITPVPLALTSVKTPGTPPPEIEVQLDGDEELEPGEKLAAELELPMSELSKVATPVPAAPPPVEMSPAAVPLAAVALQAAPIPLTAALQPAAVMATPLPLRSNPTPIPVLTPVPLRAKKPEVDVVVAEIAGRLTPVPGQLLASMLFNEEKRPRNGGLAEFIHVEVSNGPGDVAKSESGAAEQARVDYGEFEKLLRGGGAVKRLPKFNWHMPTDPAELQVMGWLEDASNLDALKNLSRGRLPEERLTRVVFEFYCRSLIDVARPEARAS